MVRFGVLGFNVSLTQTANKDNYGGFIFIASLSFLFWIFRILYYFWDGITFLQL